MSTRTVLAALTLALGACAGAPPSGLPAALAPKADGSLLLRYARC
ncbi:MAG: hypothetical protein AW08_02441 [Candidatus Accumulibacter adjunctus]|uniref:Lipoprotein n=1 Tax=Candidatus Accumulibacter adjunctus TaxID=1454001 RepID=A0A011PKP1_9PROT|nr:MAG: hypothetical protein AW08_02441 [Candidatus Accumulibacter adjunctus]